MSAKTKRNTLLEGNCGAQLSKLGLLYCFESFLFLVKLVPVANPSQSLVTTTRMTKVDFQNVEIRSEYFFNPFKASNVQTRVDFAQLKPFQTWKRSDSFAKQQKDFFVRDGFTLQKKQRTQVSETVTNCTGRGRDCFHFQAGNIRRNICQKRGNCLQIADMKLDLR